MGVIGNRIQSRQGTHSDGVLLHVECLSTGKVFPNIPIGWHAQDKALRNILRADPHAQHLVQGLTQPSCQYAEASVRPPHLTDVNTEGQKRKGGAAQISWTGSLRSLETPGVPGFSAFSGHPDDLGNLRV